MMSFPISHKTVFILEQSRHFLKSCNHLIEFDTLTKTKGPGFVPLPPISKSLWTCVVEAAVEYCRIVWDIYPQGKLVRFITCDSNATKTMNTWLQPNQNVQHLLSAFAQLGATPVPKGDCNLAAGLSSAIEALSEGSEIQLEKLRMSGADDSVKILNRGRIVCFTSLKSNAQVAKIQETFTSALMQHNKVASGSDIFLPIHECELILINVISNSESSLITDRTKEKLSPMFSFEVMTVKGGMFLAMKLTSLVLHHYHLASTTVTGIPMKEEQNASSSANYDVELFHPVQSHEGLLSGNEEDVSHVKTCKEGAEYQTVTLKWCTPRTNATELHHCTAVTRITTVDVNSRPSSCLTNFLLGGRAVMLEMPRKGGGKILSHMLAAHGGEIFIHTLITARSILEDPPSIIEGFGGRVTDYKISDFGELMKENKLVPCPLNREEQEVSASERSKAQLDRFTKYWPMTISSAYLCHLLPHLNNMPKLLVQKELEDRDVISCKQVLFDLVGLEAKNELQSIVSSISRGKGKKEDPVRAVWNEIEVMIRAHNRSESHNKILDCLLELRSKPSEKNGKALEKTEPDKVKSETDNSSPASPDPVPAKKPRLHGFGLTDIQGKKSQNLLTLWTNRVNEEHSRRAVEFKGRLNSTKLYANLHKDEEQSKET